MTVWFCRKENANTLVEMQISTIITESSMEISEQIENRYSILPNYHTSGTISKGNELSM